MKIIKTTILLSIVLSTSIYANKIVGTLEPYSKTVIKSEITGVVSKINHSISDAVQKDELLLKIDDQDYVLEYEMAKANEELSEVNYNFMQADYKRYNNLLKSKSITTQTHADRKKTFQLAKVEKQISTISTKQAKRKLDKTRIKAPYSGVVSEKFVEVGDYVSNGDTLFELVNNSKLKAVFYILQEDYQDFEKGLKVNMVIPDLEDKELKGKVNLISPTITGTNSGYKMEVILDNLNKELKANFEIELLLVKEE